MDCRQIVGTCSVFFRVYAIGLTLNQAAHQAKSMATMTANPKIILNKSHFFMTNLKA